MLSLCDLFDLHLDNVSEADVRRATALMLFAQPYYHQTRFLQRGP